MRRTSCNTAPMLVPEVMYDGAPGPVRLAIRKLARNRAAEKPLEVALRSGAKSSCLQRWASAQIKLLIRSILRVVWRIDPDKSRPRQLNASCPLLTIPGIAA